MSDRIEEEEEQHVADGPLEGGLAARMQERAEYLETHKSTWFGVPGHEDFLEVELKAVGFKTWSTLTRRHRRLRDESLQQLYTAADAILHGTLGFREKLGEDAYRDLPDHNWQTLARLRNDCPADISPRQALLFLIGDARIIPFLGEYQEWLSVVRPEVDEEVVRDFATTR